MSHRREHIASSLRRVVGQVIAEGLNDPRVRGMVSVTTVEISPDSRYAKVMVSVLPEDAGALTVSGLNAAAGHVRSRVGRKLRMRTVPMIQFQLDTSLKAQARVLDAIRHAVQTEATDIREPQRDPGDESATNEGLSS